MFSMRKVAALLMGLFLSCSPEQNWNRTRTEIRQIFEVPLVEMQFRQVIYHSKDREWWNILDSRKEALFAVPVRVQAGFNLTKGYEITPLEGAGVEVVFPPPEILLVDAEDEKLQQYFSRPSEGSLTPQELKSLLSQASGAAEEEALRAGILQTAYSNGQNFLNSFFGLLGFQSVVLRIREAAP